MPVNGSSQTRSVQLTKAGNAFFQRLDRAALEIEDAIRDFIASQKTPSSTLRLTVSHAVVGLAIEPVIADAAEDRGRQSFGGCAPGETRPRIMVEFLSLDHHQAIHALRHINDLTHALVKSSAV